MHNMNTLTPMFGIFYLPTKRMVEGTTNLMSHWMIQITSRVALGFCVDRTVRTRQDTEDGIMNESRDRIRNSIACVQEEI